ncbi:hypothetical protein [Nocardia sp. CY41]|uniref:hypothetical protein n=1 Tax=Nocardia sp. CY41 TaxID=2608686 RepID=UPI001914E1B1|nr:hypothetical protein [Nocardia sp. CY41]
MSSPDLEGPDWSVKVVRLLLPPGWSKDAALTRPTVWVPHGGFDPLYNHGHGGPPA